MTNLGDLITSSVGKSDDAVLKKVLVKLIKQERRIATLEQELQQLKVSCRG
jgi:hypothetical protein